MTRSREAILARVWQNPPTSKRYVPRSVAFPNEYVPWGIYDQREGCFVEDDEIERIDPDEKLTLR